jgi:hypothetical protein
MLCVRLVFGVAGGRAHARHSCEKSSGKIRIYNVRENFALAGTVELHKTTVLALKVRHVLNPAYLSSSSAVQPRLQHGDLVRGARSAQLLVRLGSVC